MEERESRWETSNVTLLVYVWKAHRMWIFMPCQEAQDRRDIPTGLGRSGLTCFSPKYEQRENQTTKKLRSCLITVF